MGFYKLAELFTDLAFQLGDAIQCVHVWRVKHPSAARALCEYVEFEAVKGSKEANLGGGAFDGGTIFEPNMTHGLQENFGLEQYLAPID